MEIKTIQREQVFTEMIYEKNTAILTLNERVIGLEAEIARLQAEIKKANPEQK